jgi:hypothetical protein
MKYHVLCGCGKSLPVKTEEAGTTIRCDCGESVTVPSLSKLRSTVGLGAYESGAIDTILRMLDEGILPWGETCAESGRPTRDVLPLHVQCERIHAPADNTKVILLALLVTPLALLGLRKDQREAVGRDTSVVVPLRLSRAYHRSLSRWGGGSQRRLQRLLRTVPVYARLLDEYPNATIQICPDHSEDWGGKGGVHPEI